MKCKKIISLMLALFMFSILCIENVYAVNMNEVKAGETIDNHDSGHIGINNGTIKIISNTGTLGVNDIHGVVELNNGSIGIVRNDGIIKYNNAPIEENYGTIDENHSTVTMRKGAIVGNNVLGGTLNVEGKEVGGSTVIADVKVNENNGTITVKDGILNVTTNKGTITLKGNAKVFCENNNGMIQKEDGADNCYCECKSNSGDIDSNIDNTQKDLYEIVVNGVTSNDIEFIYYFKKENNKYYIESNEGTVIKLSSEYECRNENVNTLNDYLGIRFTDSETDASAKTFTLIIHKHTFGDYINTDQTNHWKECSDLGCSGKKFFEEAHTFGNYVSNNDATYEADGTKTRTCTKCNYSETVTDVGSKLVHSKKKRKTNNDEDEKEKIEKELEKELEKEQNNTIEFNDLLINETTSYEWAKDSIYQLAKDKIINGYEDNTFKPEQNIKRDEFAKLICLVLNIKEDMTYVNKFVDIDDDWAKDKIIALSNNGIINGYDEIHFGPLNNLTNEQLVIILIKGINYFGKDILLDRDEDIENELNKISDKELISPWAKQYIASAIKYGLLTGDENKNINPVSNTTRAQVAVIIERYRKLINELNLQK